MPQLSTKNPAVKHVIDVRAVLKKFGGTHKFIAAMADYQPIEPPGKDAVYKWINRGIIPMNRWIDMRNMHGLQHRTPLTLEDFLIKGAEQK